MDDARLIVVGFILILIAAIVILSLVVSNLRKKNATIIAQAQASINAANTECENRIIVLQAKHNEEIDSIKRDCADQIRHAREDIEGQKKELEKKSEKELLTDVMIALSGYGSRFERIEKHLTDDQITERITLLFQNVTQKISGITDTLTKQIEEMNDSIERSINDSDLRQRMNGISSELEDLSSDIDDIKSSVCDRYEYDSIASDIRSIKSSVDDIHTSVSDRYSYDSLASNIDEIKSAVNDAKDAAESARYAAESAKDAVESHY